MRILMAASECVPFSKTGGLADVLGALPRAVAALGHEVAVFLPRYQVTQLEKPRVAVPSLPVALGPLVLSPAIVEGSPQGGVRVFFVEYPPFFDRPQLYGTPKAGDYPDNAERFTLFSRAVLEAAKLLFPADILHCHDWQSALVPVLLKTAYREEPAYKNTRVMFTIHNLGYQGLFPAETLEKIGLGRELFTMDKLEFWGKVNFLKGALVFADFVTTVSKKYAQEIQTPEYGFGLEGVIGERAETVAGVLNGVDYTEWNPATDPFLARKYSLDDLSGKQECKRDLLKQFGLPQKELDRPVIGIVSRFTVQKGADLIAEAAGELTKEDFCLVALGTGDAAYEKLFRDLAARFPKKIAVRIAYNNELAHKIEAGADMFLMPSRYEPCGLNQIYSLKYGTVPIVRATGGLDDTIQEDTGFKFAEYTAPALLEAVRGALAAYRDRPRWLALMRNGMKSDFSWAASAREYVRLYEKLAVRGKEAARRQ